MRGSGPSALATYSPILSPARSPSGVCAADAVGMLSDGRRSEKGGVRYPGPGGRPRSVAGICATNICLTRVSRVPATYVRTAGSPADFPVASESHTMREEETPDYRVAARDGRGPVGHRIGSRLRDR